MCLQKPIPVHARATRRLLELYRKIHLVRIDLEKAYDSPLGGPLVMFEI